MDKESDLMNQGPDEIRERIEDTRSALTAKLETLEQGVKETVCEAKAAVTGTIENVKETVKGTVETVKESLDVRSYVQEHPWPMMAGSVGLGFALGCLFPRSTSGNGHKISRMASNGRPMESAAPKTPMENKPPVEWTTDRMPASSNGAKGVLGSLMEKLRPEIQELEGIAIGAIGALIRDLIKQSAAEPLGERLEEVANKVTEKLGGQVMREPLLSQSR
jgi:ElaB/YqjD/DUF883 family membrane-anchored ribosome-binding protein